MPGLEWHQKVWWQVWMWWQIDVGEGVSVDAGQRYLLADGESGLFCSNKSRVWRAAASSNALVFAAVALVLILKGTEKKHCWRRNKTPFSIGRWLYHPGAIVAATRAHIIVIIFPIFPMARYGGLLCQQYPIHLELTWIDVHNDLCQFLLWEGVVGDDFVHYRYI